MIISFDPGEKRIGFAIFNYPYKGQEGVANLSMKKIVDLKTLDAMLIMAEEMIKRSDSEAPQKHVYVCEAFKPDIVRHGAATFHFQDMVTSECIGSIRHAAVRVGADFVKQDNRVLAQGRRWCDLPGAHKKHLDDDLSAYIHGAYYMMNQGMIGSVDDILKFGQTRLT